MEEHERQRRIREIEKEALLDRHTSSLLTRSSEEAERRRRISSDFAAPLSPYHREASMIGAVRAEEEERQRRLDELEVQMAYHSKKNLLLTKQLEQMERRRRIDEEFDPDNVVTAARSWPTETWEQRLLRETLWKAKREKQTLMMIGFSAAGALLGAGLVWLYWRRHH